MSGELAKLLEYVFPQPLWKLFGEHLREDEGRIRRGRGEKEEEQEGEV